MQIFVKSFGGVRLYFSGEGKRVKKANNRLGEFLYFVRGILRVGCRRRRGLFAGNPDTDCRARAAPMHRHAERTLRRQPSQAWRINLCNRLFNLRYVC